MFEWDEPRLYKFLWFCSTIFDWRDPMHHLWSKRTSFWSLPEAVYILYSLWALWPLFQHLHHFTTKSPRQRRHQHDSATLSSAYSVSTLRHSQVTSVVPSPAWLVNNITPRVMSPWQHHCLHDSVVTPHHGQVASATPSLAWLKGLMRTSSTSHPTWRFTNNQALGLEEYHSNWKHDLGTHLSTSLTMTWGESIITTILWDTSSNQLSHIYNSIFFRVNTYALLYFQLVNILPLV
jgi:hypothetical protein